MSASEHAPIQWRPDATKVAGQMIPLLEQVEAGRRRALRQRGNAWMAVTLCLGIGVLCGVFLAVGANPFPVGGLILFGLCAGLAGLLYYQLGYRPLKAYRHHFKSTVFRQALRIVAPGMDYLPTGMIPRPVFEYSGLFRSRIDSYEGEDLFHGNVGATKIRLSELHVKREDNSGENKQTVTVFQGIFMMADFHKDFRCHMTIEPDFAEAVFGFLGRGLQKLSGNLIRLENPEFERAFKVRGTDPVEARYILTPDMQERFLALRRTWPSGLCAAFRDSSLILAIPKTANWFEVDVRLPAGDPRHIERFLHQVLPLLFIPIQLDLNTRIWTKD